MFDLFAVSQFNKQTCSDSDVLEQKWTEGVSLAMEHTPSRVADVVHTASRQLVGIGRFESAATLYMGISAFKQAVDVLIEGHLFDKAKEIANVRAPQLLDYVAHAHETFLISNGKVEDLSRVNSDAAIEVYANRGEWNMVTSYSMVYSTYLFLYTVPFRS